MMKPQEVARSYDTIADRWNDERFPRSNGIEQHKRALTFTDLRGRALDKLWAPKTGSYISSDLRLRW